jgi:serine/threonine protein kinase
VTLSPGARLGPYEIQAASGAGGMGEVYKARDTRLDRSVAIKVLPPDVAPILTLRQAQGHPERSRGMTAAPGSSARRRPSPA